MTANVPLPPSFSHLRAEESERFHTQLLKIIPTSEENPAEPEAASTALSEVPPGYSVLNKLYEVQANEKPRARWSRFLGVSPILKPSRPSFQAYKAEVLVANKLKVLRKAGYHILHSVPVEATGTTVDHVVISPTGLVLLINVKCENNKRVVVSKNSVQVSKEERSYLSAAQQEQNYIRERFALSQIDVMSVLVFVGPNKLSIQSDAYLSGVKFTDIDGLLKFIKTEEKRHSELELASQLDVLAETGDLKRKGSEKTVVPLNLPQDTPRLFDPVTWTEHWNAEELNSKEDKLSWVETLDKDHKVAGTMMKVWLATGTLLLLAGASYTVLTVTGISPF